MFKTCLQVDQEFRQDQQINTECNR